MPPFDSHTFTSVIWFLDTYLLVGKLDFRARNRQTISQTRIEWSTAEGGTMCDFHDFGLT